MPTLFPIDGNAALQAEETHLDPANPPVGRSRYLDDVWDLSEQVADVQGQYRQMIDFGKIENPEYRELFRKYAYWKLGRVKALTLTGSGFHSAKKVFEYCDAVGLRSLASMTEEDLLGLARWLRSGSLAPSTCHRIACTAAEMFRIGQLRGWGVPANLNLSAVTSHPEWPSGKPSYQKTRTIPDETMSQVLSCALKEKDIITGGLVVILSQTGLRVSEALSIMPGCIEPAPAGTWTMEVEISKTSRSGPAKHKILVNSLVVDAVRRLEEQSPSPGIPLFSTRSECEPKRITTTVAGNRLRSFCSRWSIADPNGNAFQIHPHMFRTTFVRSLVRQGMPLAFIMEHFAHVSIEMTAHYLQLSKDELREEWGKAILSPSSAIAGKRAKQIRESVGRELKARCTEDVGDVISDLASTMSFNPLPTGVCLYDLRRGPCTNDDGCFFYNCPNYVTDMRFYPILKRELDLLEEEMSRLAKLGREREWQRQKVRRDHLEPLVRELEEQI